MKLKRAALKALVQRAQRQQAELDYAQGLPPRKRSKTYEVAYSNAYAAAEGLAHYERTPF